MQEVISSFAKDLFAGKRVLVSGATSGIGLEMARGFAALGASVAASGSSVAKIEKAEKDDANKGIEFYELTYVAMTMPLPSWRSRQGSMC